jgi:hypothetical protein
MIDDVGDRGQVELNYYSAFGEEEGPQKKNSLLESLNRVEVDSGDRPAYNSQYSTVMEEEGSTIPKEMLVGIKKP